MVPTDPAAAPLQLDILLSYYGDLNTDEIRQVLQLYLMTTRQKLQLVERLLQGDAPDIASLHREFHSLKSSSHMIGALPMANLCKTFDSMALQHDVTGVKTYWKSLADCWAQLQLEIRRNGVEVGDE